MEIKPSEISPVKTFESFVNEAKKQIERLVGLTRPNAKFISVSHSSEFTESLPELGNGYYYVSLYDEKIDSLLNKTNEGQIYLIHNIMNALSWMFLFLLIL